MYSKVMFKKGLQKALLLLCLVVTAACSDKKAPVIAQDFTSPRIKRIQSCFSSYSSKIDEYFKGKLGNQEINDFWFCHIDIIELYIKYKSTNSKNPVYSSDELYLVLQQLLPESSSAIDKDTYNSAFKFKRLILGGDKTSISKPELLKAIEKIKSLKDASIRMKKNIPVLWKFINDAQAVSYSEMKGSWPVVGQELKVMLTEVFSEEVTFSDLRDLLLEFIDKEKNKKQLTALVEVIKSYTSIFVGEDKKANDEKVINNYLDLAAIYIHGRLGVLDWVNGEENEHLISLLEKVLGTLGESINSRPSQVIEFKYWQVLFKNLSSFLKVDSDNTNASDKIWLLINNKFLNASNGDFAVKQLELIQSGLTDWKKSINSYDEILNQKSFCQAGLSPLGFQDTIQVNAYLVKCANLKFSIDGKGSLVIKQNSGDNNSDEATFKSVNFKRVFLKPLFRVYAESKYEFTKAQFRDVFKDISEAIAPFTNDEGGISAMYKKIAIEADIFTPFSVANSLTSIFELALYAQYLHSGSNIVSEIKKSFDQDCVYENKISQDCVVSHFPKYGKVALSGFPELNNFLTQLPEESRGKFLLKSFSIVTDPNDEDIEPGFMSSFDLLEAMILWHYDEVYFVGNDKDLSRDLSYAEIEESFTKVKPIILELFGAIFPDLDEEKGLGIYSFLVSKGYLVESDGEVPDDINDSLVFQHWIKFSGKRASSATRMELISVLEFLNQLI